MKLLIVINDYFNLSNGMAISTQRFVKEFKEAGHEVRVLACDAGGKADYAVPFIQFPIIKNIVAKQGFHFGKPVRKTMEEAVTWADHVHIEDPFRLCYKTAKLARKAGKPVTGTFHLYPENMTASAGILNNKFCNGLIMRIFRDISYRSCSLIQCPTDKVKERLIRFHFRPKLVTISNGISQEFIDNSHVDSPNHTFTIVCVGRFSKEKNQKTLLQALKNFPNGDQIKLILAGKGPLENEYRRMAEELPCKVIMRYFPPEELKKLLAESDLVVHCAYVEVEGMSCMEAFASGCIPVIAESRLSSTAIYALSDYNKFKARDRKDLMEKIDYWYSHPEEMEGMRNRYRKLAEELSVKNSAEKALRMLQGK